MCLIAKSNGKSCAQIKTRERAALVNHTFLKTGSSAGAVSRGFICCYKQGAPLEPVQPSEKEVGLQMHTDSFFISIGLFHRPPGFLFIIVTECIAQPFFIAA
jgi:hypothetical protein